MSKSEVFLLDCIEGMSRYADKHFDLAVVDPPYGIGDFNQKRSRKFHRKIEWNEAIPTEDYFIELYRVSKNQIIWGSEYYAKYIHSPGRIVHDKTGGPGKAPQLKELSDVDIASHSFGVNHKIFHYTWRGNVQGDTVNWKNTGLDARVHPCQKPVALYDWIFKNYAKEGDKILDTHLGSGSSRIAAHRAGFDFVGFEIDQEYFDKANKRFEDYRAQLKLF